MATKYVVDRGGKIIGRYREGITTLYYDLNGRQIARTQQSGRILVLIDQQSGRQIGRFDGSFTVDGSGRMVGRGKLFHFIVYPTAKR